MQQVDVTLNIFAKPYQTALSLLTLLKYSRQHIDVIYLQYEPAGSRYDAVPPYAISDYLREAGYKLAIFQPEIWVECDAVEPGRLTDPAYRLALRYQYSFEKTDKKYLFFMHNDVLVKRDIIGALLQEADGAFAVGPLGQCWNCPASNATVMREAGFGPEPCTPERYFDFRPDVAALERIYALGQEQGFPVRPYWEGWQTHYSTQGWPLPECRVNEWGCLVDVEATRPLTIPFGEILPFGAYEYCGSVTLDISVSWFRELNRLGLRARHVPQDKYLKHFVGSFRMSHRLYQEAELEAQQILLKAFPDFVAWCGRKGINMFN